MVHFCEPVYKANTFISTYYPFEMVSGYTLCQIEQALKGCTTLEQWRDRLKSMYSNPTSVYLDELFDNYINL